MENMNLTAQYWLSLPDHKAFEVFDGPVSAVVGTYRRLVQHWHPDRNGDPQAADVLIRIQQLYRLVRRGSPAKNRASGSSIEVSDDSGRVFRYQGQQVNEFELGRVFRAKKSFAYHVASKHQALFDRFVSRVQRLNYASEDMRQGLSGLLPSIIGRAWGPQGGLLVLRRPDGFIRLRDLLEYHQLRHPGEGIPAVHVAWIISGLINLACYLAHQKLTHNAISLDNVWVGPEKHDVALLGGWFFAQPEGSKLDFLPTSSVTLASSRFLSEKTARCRFDLELTRALGRSLLGDATGARLASMGHPQAMLDFLIMSSNRTAVEDYRAWKQVLQASFGPPKFVPINLTSTDIYKEN